MRPCIALVLVACGCAAASPAPVEIVPPAPSPTPPDLVDPTTARAALERARDAWERGDRSPQAATALERAGRALRRGGGKARAFAAFATEQPRATKDGRIVVPIVDQSSESAAIAVLAVEDAATARTAHRAPRLFPRRALLRPGMEVKTTSGADGAFLAAAETAAWVFPSIDRAPLVFRGQIRATIDGKGLGLVLESHDAGAATSATAHVLDLVRGTERFAYPLVSPYEARLSYDGRYLEQCPYQSEERAFIVDATTGKEIFASRGNVRACATDVPAKRVAVAYDEPDGKRVELWGLEPPTKIGEGHWKGPDFDSPTVWFDATSGAVELVSAPYKGSIERKARWDAKTMKGLPKAKPPKPAAKATKAAEEKKPSEADVRNAIAALPMASATSTTDLGALRGLASPGAKLIANYDSYSAGWAENGARSRDGSTFALLEEAGEERGDPSLLLFDSATLARRHRIPLDPKGYMWSTLYYLDDATVVVRLEWTYSIIDVATGELLLREPLEPGSPTGIEAPVLLAPNLLAIGASLYDLSRPRATGTGAAEREVEGPYLDLRVPHRPDPARMAVTALGKTVVFAGTKVEADEEPPAWLLCEIGDEYFPYPACR